MVHGLIKQPFAFPGCTIATYDTLPQLHTTPYNESYNCIVSGSGLCSCSNLVFYYLVPLAMWAKCSWPIEMHWFWSRRVCWSRALLILALLQVLILRQYMLPFAHLSIAKKCFCKAVHANVLQWLQCEVQLNWLWSILGWTYITQLLCPKVPNC